MNWKLINKISWNLVGPASVVGLGMIAFFVWVAKTHQALTISPHVFVLTSAVVIPTSLVIAFLGIITGTVTSIKIAKG